MASSTLTCAIRPAETAEQACNFWWPMMKELEWNRDHADAATHFHVAQNGKHWLLLTPSDSSKPEGCITAFTYPNATAWVAFFILSAPFRGKGHGRDLWREMEKLLEKDGAEMVGLDGVEEQLETYKRRGFVDCASIALMTRESLVQSPLPDSDTREEKSDDYDIRDIKAVDRIQLAKLDTQHTGLDRSAYWTTSGLPDRADAFGYASFKGQELTGFVLVRRSEHGHRIGPLYAADLPEARHLLRRAMRDLATSEGNLIAEIFDQNEKGRRVFEELGWKYVDLSYHRMWLHGKVPQEQQKGGRAEKGMWAIFDACAGYYGSLRKMMQSLQIPLELYNSAAPTPTTPTAKHDLPEDDDFDVSTDMGGRNELAVDTEELLAAINDEDREDEVEAKIEAKPTANARPKAKQGESGQVAASIVNLKQRCKAASSKVAALGLDQPKTVTDIYPRVVYYLPLDQPNDTETSQFAADVAALENYIDAVDVEMACMDDDAGDGADLTAMMPRFHHFRKSALELLTTPQLAQPLPMHKFIVIVNSNLPIDEADYDDDESIAILQCTHSQGEITWDGASKIVSRV